MSDPFALLDDKQLEYFGQPVTLHDPAGDRPLTGVFDSADDVAQAKIGGYVKVVQPQLELKDADAVGVERSTQFTIDGQRYRVVAPPKSANGWTTLILAVTNGQPSPAPDIQY